ncbi:MAG: UvrD-helicase domain-containing protein [Tabrizicola sp.]|nr:UvrD-helicase domain-containing protein [Tabrizicola sp.]
MTITPATRMQIDAANPGQNTWLSANAGSGKTSVLTNRVARLLLQGVDPQRILCLTYTKAAASEMQNRLFQRLGDWAMKPDADLRLALQALGEEELSTARLSRARQLFARAIETPGGLRLQTIHSFCASLLRRFPLEAGVAPGFTEMDDRAAKLLRAEIVEELADSLAPDAVRGLAEVHSGEDFTAFVDQIARHRDAFNPPLDQGQIWRLFDLPLGFDERPILAGVFLGDEAGWMPDVVSGLTQGGTNDGKAAKRLTVVDLARPSLGGLALLEDLFLFGEKTKAPFAAKIGSFPTKDTQAKLGPLLDRLEALMRRVETARSQRIALQAARKTLALHRFAGAFLTDPSLAAWVLYRLDGGIDHILVDEAQDTSPGQWRLIESLAGELTSGQGASTRDRTLFVVGDKKQSIYSFQGADVAAFDRMQDQFKAQLAGGKALASRTLDYSFRSSPAVLKVVDQTFVDETHAALGGPSAHKAFHEALPGRVDVWPVIEKSGKDDPGPWFDPVDAPQPEDPHVVLARQIAGWMRDRVVGGEQIPQAVRHGSPPQRPIRYGDFLILVQRRSPLFHEIIRACKKLDLPIAGADRLKLGGELAVKDLAALLAFLDTPEDDLSLAAVLRSPLCGWSEDDLFALAQPRPGFLWEALRNHPNHTETRAFLNDMRAQADFLRPFDLIERALTRHDGRRKLLDRLGAEAEDGIDELLGQALAYEASEVPSLTGFLVWMQTDDVEVKRQLDGEGDRIRVMTVHGAKGLEAEIVILPDTADRKKRDPDELYRLNGREAVWKVPSTESPAVIAAERAARDARDRAERLRLLYVAMTRARCWLVVAAAGDVKQEDCWYSLIRDGVERSKAADAGAGIRRHSFGDWPSVAPVQGKTVPDLARPDWLARPAPVPSSGPRVLSPSDLGGPKALPSEAAHDSDEAKRRGTLLHLLLERLPGLRRDDWAAHALGLVGDPDRAPVLLAEAQRVLDDPALARLFAPDTLAEVAVSGDWRGARLLGSVDRLLIAPDRILVVDYKSNTVIPDRPDQVPEGILRQLGAYAHLLAQAYPDRRIETAILWTRAPRLMPIDPDIVRQALDRTTIP